LAEQDKVACFLDQLVRDASVQEWQVNQAEPAVMLYLNVFLPEENRDRPASSKGRGKAVGRDLEPAARDALEKMKELLRMRHYAYRTEQTYLEWVGRYLMYAAAQGLDWQKSGSVRGYLSHLALNQSVASSTQNQALNAFFFFFEKR
jgi:hypothetical protein